MRWRWNWKTLQTPILVALAWLLATLIPLGGDAFWQNQKKALLSALQKSLDATISYGHLSSNIFEYLDFHDVKIRANGRDIFYASGIRVYWNWLAIFQGHEENAIARLQIINSRVQLDTQKDAKFLANGEHLLTDTKAQAPPPIEIFNMSADITTPVGHFSTVNGFLTLKRQANEWQMIFRTALEGHLVKAVYGLSSGTTSLQGVLHVDNQFQDWVIKAHADTLSTNLFDLGAFGFQLERTPTKVLISKTQDQQALDLSVLWDHQGIKAQMTTDHYQFLQWLHWKNSLAVNRWLATTWTGKVALDWNPLTQFWQANLKGQALFSRDLFPDQSSATADIQADSRVIRVKQFEFDTLHGALGFQGDILVKSKLPQGILTVKHWNFPGLGTFNGETVLQRQEDYCTFQGKHWLWNRLQFNKPHGRFDFKGQQVAFLINSGWKDYPEFSLGLSGTVSLKASSFAVAYSVGNLPLAGVASQAGPVALDAALVNALSGWQVSSSGLVRSSSEGLEATPSLWKLVDIKNPRRNVSFNFAFQKRLLKVSQVTGQWDNFPFSGDLSVDFQKKDHISLRSDWDLYQKHFDLQGEYWPSLRRFILGGSSGISGVWEGTPEAWLASVQVQRFPLPGGGSLSFQGSLSQQGTNLSGGFYDGTWQGFYPLGKAPFTVNWYAGLEDHRLAIHILRWSDLWGVRQGSLALSWGKLSVPWRAELRITSPEGESEHIQVNWLWGEVINVDAKWRHSPVQRFLPAPWQGTWQGQGNFVWTKTDGVSWNAVIASEKFFYGNDPVAVSCGLSGTLSHGEIHGFKGSWGGGSISDGRLSLDWQKKEWTWVSHQSVSVAGKKWTWQGVNQGRWKGENQTLQLETTYQWSNAQLGGLHFPSGVFQGELHGQNWRLSSVDGIFKAQGQGLSHYEVHILSPQGTILNAEGRLSPQNFHTEVTSFRLPLKEIAPWLNSDMLRIHEGVMVGSVNIFGSWIDPSITGDAELQNFVFNNAFLRKTVGPFSGAIEFRDKTITIPEVNVGPKGQSWLVGGTLHFDHAAIDHFNLSVRTDELSWIPARYVLTGIDAEGWASGELSFIGDAYAMTVRGDLTVQNTEMRLIPVQETPESNYGLNVDLHIKTGRKVEFVWPDPNIPLVKATAMPGQKLLIRYNDQASQLSLLGVIEFLTGEINYVSQTFQIQDGKLTFHESESSFDPHLSVHADLKTRDSEGPVIIILKADGPLSEFSPTFSTIPYRTPEELQQLLGTTLAVASSTTPLDSAFSVASDLGSGILLRPFEESVKKSFGLDLFSIRTQILEKALTQSSSATSSYLDNTRVYFGKYLGDKLFLQGDLNIHQNPVVGGIQTTGFQVDPEIQMEFTTPFFLLNWTIVPQHVQSLFVTDNTVTFSWNWSY